MSMWKRRERFARSGVLGLLVMVVAALLCPPAVADARSVAHAPGLGKSNVVAGPTVFDQRFEGGGTGTVAVGVQFESFRGHYTSNGQLGNGTYFFDELRSTATLARSDGMTMTGTFVSGNHCVATDPVIECGHADLLGSADVASAHLDLSLVSGTSGSSTPMPSGFLMTGFLIVNHRIGYAMVDGNGSTYTFGGVDAGSLATPGVVDIRLTSSGAGGWMVTDSGRVLGFGEGAPAFISPNGPPALGMGERVVSLSPTRTERGYWLFTSKGRVIPFGDAHFLGDLHTTTLNGHVIGSSATSTGRGYYMVGSDGGVFAFGDAKFRGSTGNMRLNRPVVGLVPTADNAGYWLVASDGGVFSFNAPFHGSMGGVTLNQSIVTMVRYGNSYLMIASDGGVFNFSKGPFFGSEGGAHVPIPIISGSSVG
jgi:hypothetical protein